MLGKFNDYRSHADNVRLGILTAFSAGMVNVISVIVFFAFTSNVTGHYAILAQEISLGNWYQAGVVIIWIAAFFFGNFISNLFVINAKSKTSRLLSHAIPLLLEIVCLLSVGVYLNHFFTDTLRETEFLVGMTLFAMGLQNGLTASISNFLVKTTHLTGLTTELGILMAMFTQKKFRKDFKLVQRAQLLIAIISAYMVGGVIAGFIFYKVQYTAFYIVCSTLAMIIIYDLSRAKIGRLKVKLPEVINPTLNKGHDLKANTINSIDKREINA